MESVGFIPFHKVEPELAERETRTITVVRTNNDLPEGTYGLIESYCIANLKLAPS